MTTAILFFLNKTNSQQHKDIALFRGAYVMVVVKPTETNTFMMFTMLVLLVQCRLSVTNIANTLIQEAMIYLLAVGSQNDHLHMRNK